MTEADGDERDDPDVEAAARVAAEQARRAVYRRFAIELREEALAAARGAGTVGNHIASALAGAWLAAPAWTRSDLVRATRLTLGVAPLWMRPVIGEVLDAYVRAPLDRPRELARFVARLRSFRRHIPGAPGARQREVAARRQRTARVRPVVVRPRVRVWTATPTRMVRRPFRTPVIDDIGALAEWLGLTIEALDWHADRRDLNRRARDRRLEHYAYVWLNGRLIEAPKPRLKSLQRRVLAELIALIPTHPAAHGFVPGRSPHTFAAPHAGQPMVIRLDVTSFFAACTAPRVYGIFRMAGYPEPVAHTLTGLSATRTPLRIRAAAPRSAPDRAYRVALLAATHLPQGAPTSPALANLCGFRLDRRLTGLAQRFHARYTRYADDLAFSGPLSTSAAQSLVAAATAICADEGFRVNAAKTRLRGQADRQRLAGLVVNEQPAPPRDEYDRLRALLHNAARTGLDEQNRDGLLDFRARIAGRIAWVGHGRPARAAKLRALLDAAPD